MLKSILVLIFMVFGLPAIAADITIQKHAYPFKVRNWIMINGPIEPGDGIKFLDVVASTKHVSAVVLQSNGGYVEEGLTIATAIRDMGLSTLVPENASCDSICSVMFLAGKQKYLYSSSRVGVHSAFNGNTKMPDPEANAEIGYFFATIGMSEEVLNLWTSVPPSEIVDINDEDYIEMLGLDFINLDDYSKTIGDKLVGMF